MYTWMKASFFLLQPPLLSLRCFSQPIPLRGSLFQLLLILHKLSHREQFCLQVPSLSTALSLPSNISQSDATVNSTPTPTTSKLQPPLATSPHTLPLVVDFNNYNPVPTPSQPSISPASHPTTSTIQPQCTHTMKLWHMPPSANSVTKTLSPPSPISTVSASLKQTNSQYKQINSMMCSYGIGMHCYAMILGHWFPIIPLWMS